MRRRKKARKFETEQKQVGEDVDVVDEERLRGVVLDEGRARDTDVQRNERG